MRIVVFSERLRAPYDEGIKNFAVHLGQALSALGHELLVLTSDGRDDPRYGIQNIDVNRALLDPRLRAVIRRFAPEAIIYIPTACGTVFSFARARVLRACARNACTALIALQPRPYTAMGRFFIRRLAPSLDWVLVQSTRTRNVLRALGCHTALLPPAVDTTRFCPASPAEKAELRVRYGVPASARVVTHVGHLRSERNLEHFLAFQAARGYYTLVVASTSTPHANRTAGREHITQALITSGTRVMDTYLPDIEDIYRLSDLYLFLAESDTAAIELPLSVLEAMACNLPVVCTPFGGLQDFYAGGQGLFYWDGQAQLGDLVATALSTTVETRMMVEPHTWAAAARACVRLLQAGQLQGLESGQGGVEGRPTGEEST